jgi:hypothetical protein
VYCRLGEDGSAVSAIVGCFGVNDTVDVDGHENPRESDGRAVSTTCLSSRASGTSGARNRHQCR